MGAVLALLPRGRAWQTHEGGPRQARERSFDPGSFDHGSFATEQETSGVLRNFWEAIADVFDYATQRLCALRLEFWCASESETHNEWMTEYGLPDTCDPFPDLCTKVAAVGGTRCEYYAAVAARAGWSISCRDFFVSCGSRAGCGKAGHFKTGRRGSAQLVIVVDMDSSPAYTGSSRRPAKAGHFKAGRRLACGPDLSALECLLARIVHAEIQIQYEAI